MQMGALVDGVGRQGGAGGTRRGRESITARPREARHGTARHSGELEGAACSHAGPSSAFFSAQPTRRQAHSAPRARLTQRGRACCEPLQGAASAGLKSPRGASRSRLARFARRAARLALRPHHEHHRHSDSGASAHSRARPARSRHSGSRHAASASQHFASCASSRPFTPDRLPERAVPQPPCRSARAPSWPRWPSCSDSDFSVRRRDGMNAAASATRAALA
jgi:hypothetical protein